MRKRPNFKQEILEFLGGEKVESIVVSKSRAYFSDDASFEKAGEIITWDEAAPILDYTYDSGYGGQDCHSIYIWTPNRIIFVCEYDGSTGLSSIPRNPTRGEPSAQ